MSYENVDVFRTSDQKDVGEVVVTTWINDDRISLAELKAQQVSARMV